MRPNEYFIQTTNPATTAAQILSYTETIFEHLTSHVDSMDENELIYVAQMAKKHSKRAQDSGNESLFQLFGLIADYSHLLLQEITRTIDDSKTSYNLDLKSLEKLFTQTLTNEIAIRLSLEKQISTEEAKVYMTLSDTFKIDFKYYF